MEAKHLQLPKCPELKDKALDFTPTNINVDNIPYRDKLKEKQRKKKLAKERKNKQSKLTLKERKRAAAGSLHSESVIDDINNVEDLEEMDHDYKIVRKLKRRKGLSKSQISKLEDELAPNTDHSTTVDTSCEK